MPYFAKRYDTTHNLESHWGFESNSFFFPQFKEEYLKMSSNREKNMMKRSDFAQKLLDDLQLRKERLGSSRNSSNPSCIPSDKYGYPKNGLKRSVEFKTKNTSTQVLNMQNSYSGGSKSLTRAEASNQILPFGRGHSSEKIDLSKALAFALENAGKATRIDPSGSASIISFLQQVGRRSMGYGTVERKGSVGVQQSSSSQFPMIHVHIKEISKGTQKLNQIIKACRNGLGFGNGRYSKEYGKELMQGAIELEQSLRMLVNIQEASDYPTGSQKTNRIKLLDDNGEEQDDDDDETQKSHDRMQLEMPSRYYQNIKEVARADIKVRLSALAYPENDNIDRNKHFRARSHWRSVTCDEAGLPSFTVDNNQSKSSKPGTGRIPSVIAKLMGLGEFPEDEDTKPKESTLKTEIENDVSIKFVKVDQRRKDADLVMKNTGQKAMQSNKVAPLENLIAPMPQRKPTSMNIDLDLVMHDEIRVENATTDKTKSQKHIWGKERGKDDEDNIRRNNYVKGEAKQVSSKNEAQRTTQYMNRRAIPTGAFQEEKEYKPNAPQTENKQRTSQQKPQNHLSFEPKRMFHKSEPRETRGGEKRYNANEQLQRRRQKANVLVTNHSPKPLSSGDVQKKLPLKNKAKAHRKIFSESDGALDTNRSPNGSHQLKPRNESLHLAQFNREDVNHKSSRIVPSLPDPKTERDYSDDPLGKKEKPVLIQVSQKAKEGNVHKGEIPQNINQAMAKQNKTFRMSTRPLEYQSTDSKEGTDGRKELLSSHKDTDQIKSNQTEAAEETTIKSEVPAAGIQSPDRTVANNDQKKIEDDSLLLMLITRENGRRILKDVPGQTPANEFQESMLRDGKGPQDPTSICDGNANTLPQAVPKMLKGTKGEIETSLPKLEEPHKHPTRKMTETLSESEIQLKKIILKSQLFLDTAEALFKLSIPLSILHTDGNNYNRDDNNLILDCGYELMKRKGRLQELSIHPFVKVPISSSKVKSLEDLVKQLSKEFKKLRSYGREDCTKPVVEHYLPKILERDVHYKDPELNSMWDMGWNDSMLAFIERDDVVRDTERYVFNKLVEEVTRDLICI